MNDRPTAVELLRAVRRFLQREVVPVLDGPSRFHARVAANVVGIVAREIETEEEHLRGEWRRLGELLGQDGPLPDGRDALRDAVRARTEELVRRIRAGAFESGPEREAVLAHLTRTVDDKLDVSQPPREE